jgi:hypothetical protein
MDRQQGNEGLEKTTAGTCLLAFGFSALGFGSFFFFCLLACLLFGLAQVSSSFLSLE